MQVLIKYTVQHSAVVSVPKYCAQRAMHLYGIGRITPIWDTAHLTFANSCVSTLQSVPCHTGVHRARAILVSNKLNTKSFHVSDAWWDACKWVMCSVDVEDGESLETFMCHERERMGQKMRKGDKTWNTEQLLRVWGKNLSMLHLCRSVDVHIQSNLHKVL